MPSVTRQPKSTAKVAQEMRTTKKVSHTQEMKKNTVVTKKIVTKNNIPVTRKVSTQKSSPSSKKIKPSPSFIVRSVKRGSKKAVKRMLLSPVFHRVVQYSAVLGVLVLVVYGVYQTASTTFANEVVVSKSEIISRVAKHQALPSVTPIDIVRVQDPATLKEQNSFYESVKEGDYILMYPTMAVIYDLRNDVIVGVKVLEDGGDRGVPASF